MGGGNSRNTGDMIREPHMIRLLCKRTYILPAIVLGFIIQRSLVSSVLSLPINPFYSGGVTS